MGRVNEVRYDIRVKGHLDPGHSDWLGGLGLHSEIRHDQPVTLLSGPLADQAELFGVLDKLQALGVVLLEVVRLEPQARNTPRGDHATAHTIEEDS